MCELKAKLESVTSRINQAEIKFNRKPNTVKLLAVSKTKPISAIKQAIEHGQFEFGENYLQDALSKINAIDNQNIKWHFIGAMQSNKAKLIAQNFSWVHTIDNFKIANKLNKFRQGFSTPLNVCIQVNTSLEAAKAGCQPAESFELAKQITELQNLKLRGLMAIPKPENSFSKQKESFMKLKTIFDELVTKSFKLDTLSIGMSGDLEAAIAAGSTMVRIGTDIFGART